MAHGRRERPEDTRGHMNGAPLQLAAGAAANGPARRGPGDGCPRVRTHLERRRLTIRSNSAREAGSSRRWPKPASSTK